MTAPSLSELAGAGESTKPVGLEPGALRQVKLRRYAIRFAFGAAISVAAGLATMRFGPRFGGLLLAFPAILPASLTLIEKEEGERAAEADIVGAVLGSCGMVAFALTAFALLPRLAAPAALAAAFAAWAVVAMTLFWVTRGYPK